MPSITYSLSNLSLQNGVSFEGGNSQYSYISAIARQEIIDSFGWTIEDNGFISPTVTGKTYISQWDTNLISSGSLLIIVKAENTNDVVFNVRKLGIKASVIGEVLSDKSIRRMVRKDGSARPLIMPESDSLWAALKKNP